MNLEQFGGLSELETVETAMLRAKDYEQTPALKVFQAWILALSREVTRLRFYRNREDLMKYFEE